MYSIHVSVIVCAACQSKCCRAPPSLRMGFVERLRRLEGRVEDIDRKVEDYKKDTQTELCTLSQTVDGTVKQVADLTHRVTKLETRPKGRSSHG